MQEISKDTSCAECVETYDLYARDVRGLAASTREIQRRVLSRFCCFRFGAGPVAWQRICFTDVVRFLTAEFERLPNRGTQRVLLVAMRAILRYLAEKNAIPQGWDEALPGTATRRHAHLPRQLSREQVRALFVASQGKKPRALRDRALFLLLLRLGLRCEEIAHLRWQDIGWEEGSLRICSQKCRRERILPLPEDVGKALAAYLRTFSSRPTWVFDSIRTSFPLETRRFHIKAIARYLFDRAGIVGRSAHSLRHTVATTMVNHGASFKEVADMLGHRWLSTTLIYAKLDMKALAQVALRWPGGEL